MNIYLNDSFPGEGLMLTAIQECIEWNLEACRYPNFRGVCWL